MAGSRRLKQFLSVTSALLLLAAGGMAGCDGGHCVEGIWQSTGSSDCDECSIVSFMWLKDNGSFFMVREAVWCEWGSSEFIHVDIIENHGYAVDGDTFILSPDDDDPPKGLFTCSETDLTITGLASGGGGGNWVRVSGEKQSAIEALFFGRCDGFQACTGGEMPLPQCTEDEDCLTTPSADNPSECDDGYCSNDCH
ncbi:MAG: hypothetical protein JXR96_10195 [Deltaproteobacteria bacterium]|nr:hypothetical protein [Deltaproteobacteria bacterium]